MASSKRTLYVGGLADEVDRNLVKSTFLPFGDIVDVNMPMDYNTKKHKGFAFVEFQLPEDAADAIDNMDNSEILGRTIRVNLAKPVKFRDSNSRPVWASDDYLRKVDGCDGDDGEDSNEEDEGDQEACEQDARPDEAN